MAVPMYVGIGNDSFAITASFFTNSDFGQLPLTTLCLQLFCPLISYPVHLNSFVKKRWLVWRTQ